MPEDSKIRFSDTLTFDSQYLGRKQKVLALFTDPYDGYGGIAQFNRDLLNALIGLDEIAYVLSFPRNKSQCKYPLPKKILEFNNARNPFIYSLKVLAASLSNRPELIICGHANLLPVAAILKRLIKAKLWLILHGIEVWESKGFLIRSAVQQNDLITAVSRYTREQYLSWSRTSPEKVVVLPNTIDLKKFIYTSRPEYLVERYSTKNRRVLLTVGRIASIERQKGHERIIRILPILLDSIPDLLYMIIGDGDDMDRLRNLCRERGLQDNVLFTGKIIEEEIIDHYNLADAFAMPSTQEGFGIVFLEAASCGLPVLGGGIDGSRDPLQDGNIGILVDPHNDDSIINGIITLMSRDKIVPAEIRNFCHTRFSYLIRGIVHRIICS